jgi:hypothetical protein
MAIQFLDQVLERLPFRVEVIQTGNGVEFGASLDGATTTQPTPAAANARASPNPVVPAS